MISLSAKRTELQSSELRTILRCIYFKHYLRWDGPFLDPENFRKRESLIEKLYSAEVSRIGGDDTFGTNGDDKRSFVARYSRRAPRIGALLEKIFGPKMPRIMGVMLILRGAQWVLGGSLFRCTGTLMKEWTSIRPLNMPFTLYDPRAPTSQVRCGFSSTLLSSDWEANRNGSGS